MKYFTKTAKDETKLKPHQKRVLKKLQDQESLLVYHGLGSGKTLTALKAGESLPGPTTVIGPASLKQNFADEAKKFDVSEKVNYFSYAKPPEKSNFDFLVFDEAQRMGRLESQRSHYPDKYQGKKELFLSGTPIRNEPSELIPLLRGLGVNVPRDKKKFKETFIQEKKEKVPILARLFRGVKPGTTYEAKNLEALKNALKGKVDYHGNKKET